MLLVLFLIFICIFAYKNKKYKESTYYKITANPYLSVCLDKGRLGEYAIYRYLKRFENDNVKFLFNVYVPKENGTTTEIDVLMICPKGILVFESKNYSGWIFGNEQQKNWTQVLPKGRGRSQKEHFFNPIMQNKGHINCLKSIIDKEVDFKSIIVFSNRCTLKEITLKNQEIKVINRYRVVEIVAEILGGIEENCLDSENIKFLYEKIFPFTQVEESVKKQHIKNIQVASEDVNQKINEDIETKKQTVSDTVGKVCPKCGNNMVLRTAQKGQHVGKQFWGCTNYPKCRYIQNIDGLSLRKKK